MADGMLGRLFDLLAGEVIGLYGNHDVHYNPELTEHDSFSLLVKAGRIKLLSADSPWRGAIGGRPVVVGGASYRQPIPSRIDPLETNAAAGPPLGIWLTHHDINMPGYDEGWIKPHEIDGVELVVNGHIHRRLESVQAGKTLWVTPGNISRRARSDATRVHVPAVLHVEVTADSFTLSHVTIPHQPYGEVFYEAVIAETTDSGSSAFVTGLAELQSRRTASGAGLMEFLERNLSQFEPPVADEIMNLAMEVTANVQGESGNRVV